MKLIDFHTHFFPNKLLDAIWAWFERNDWPIEYKKYVEDLVPILKKEGVERCVHLHYPHKEGMSESLNAWAHGLEKKFPDYIIPFGSVHPDDKNPEEILRQCFEDYQMKGLKIHCHVQKVAPDDNRMIPVYEMCEAYQKILLMHCGTGPHFKDKTDTAYGYDVATVSGVRKFEKIIKKYPKMIFVVPHLGYEEVNEFFEILPDYPNLYLDTTMTLANYFPELVSPDQLAQHADRLIFGTDFPNIPYEWSREKKNLLAMNIGKENEEKIFYRNAKKLLQLT